MKKTNQIIGIVLTVISLFLISYLIELINLNTLVKTLQNADLKFIVVAIFFTLISLMLRTLRWKTLLDEKYKSDYFKILQIQTVGLALSNLSPGKVLEPSKLIPLKKEGVDYGFGLLTIFWERALDLLVLFSFATLIIYKFDRIGADFFLIIFGLLLAIMLTMYRNFNDVLKFLIRFKALSFLKNIEPHNFSFKTLLSTFIIANLVWASDAVSIYFVLLAFKININYFTIISSWSAAVLIGVASFLPGGLGSAEASMVYFLSTSVFSITALIAAVFVTRIVLNGTVLVLGIYWMPKIRKYFK